jgi:FlaA1/EpsC-like NDP-sugar epimerase
LHERLFLDQEHLQPTGHDKLLLPQPEGADLTEIRKHLLGLIDACQSAEEEKILRCLRALVPEFRPDVVDMTMERNLASVA